MNEFYSQKAIELANRNYLTFVFRDNEDGEEGYIAINPQFDGCMSQGNTPQEAIDNLLDARTLYIETLLEENVPIPVPLTSSNIQITIDLADFSGHVEKSEQSTARLGVVETSKEGEKVNLSSPIGA